MEYQILLKELGFTQYEAKVYLSLLSLSSAKASEITKHSNVPSNKVYESLIRLAERGFISSLDLSPRVYKITGVEKLREVLEKKEKKITTLRSSINKLESDIGRCRVDATDIATVLKSKQNIVAKLHEQTPKLQKYQYTFGGGLTFSAKGARIVSQAIKRGVETRFLVHYDPSRKEVYQKWRKIGVKIKFHPKNEQKSIRFSTMDNKIARITIGKPQMENEDDYLTFWIESPAFASMLKDQFLDMWEKAEE